MSGTFNCFFCYYYYFRQFFLDLVSFPSLFSRPRDANKQKEEPPEAPAFPPRLRVRTAEWRARTAAESSSLVFGVRTRWQEGFRACVSFRPSRGPCTTAVHGSSSSPPSPPSLPPSLLSVGGGTGKASSMGAEHVACLACVATLSRYIAKSLFTKRLLLHVVCACLPEIAAM